MEKKKKEFVRPYWLKTAEELKYFGYLLSLEVFAERPQ